jgi:NDMA-dependent alcohol dehydrogenase
MRTEAAILWEFGGDWSVEEIELDAPRSGEVLLEVVASGMCHSDEHLRTGDLPFLPPIIGGHEGAGVVVEVGPEVSWLQPGDHVITSFIPACGRCPSCASGHSNLCDLGAHLGARGQIADGTSRHHARGEDLATMCLLGTFAAHTVVNEASCIKVDPSVPLEQACLLGCGVVTGWGSAVNAAGTGPADTIVVVGIGGIGASALLGARAAGAKQIVAVDPVGSKRERALAFGATHTAPSLGEARNLIKEITWGRMANQLVMCMGVGDGQLLLDALSCVGKRGEVVVTNIHPASEISVSMSLLDLTLQEKVVRGSLFGSGNPRADVPKLLELHAAGELPLDQLVTQTYPLERINDGYEDMRDGTNIRGVLLPGSGG